jgi:hypothetical protein
MRRGVNESPTTMEDITMKAAADMRIMPYWGLFLQFRLPFLLIRDLLS